MIERSLKVGLAAALASAAIFACGARTGLPVPDIAQGGGGNGGSAPLECKAGDITLIRATPTVMFVLDRSGSMDRPLDNTGASRWETLTDSLSTTLPPVNETMRIGATFFPSDTATSHSASCTTAPTPALQVGEGHVATLIELMKEEQPNGATPTATAIDAAATALLSARAATKSRAMVLATDGAPNCNDALDPATCTCAAPDGDCGHGQQGNGFNMCLDDVRTVDMLDKYRKQGLPTYVVGIAGDTDVTFEHVLDELAVAGGRPRQATSPRYYQGSSHAELTAAFTVIRDQVGRCTYLTTSVPSGGGTIVVTIDGVVVPFDSSGESGWAWSNEADGELLFSSDSCDTAASAPQGAVVATITCNDGGTDAGSDADANPDGSTPDASDVDAGLGD